MAENSEAEITERQRSYIMSLLSKRMVSQRLGSRIIQALEKQPVINDSGLEDWKEKVKQPNT